MTRKCEVRLGLKTDNTCRAIWTPQKMFGTKGDADPGSDNGYLTSKDLRKWWELYVAC